MAGHNKVVKITVKKNQIDVVPEDVTIDINDTLRWESTDAGRFTIEFKNDSPFDKKAYPHNEAIQARRHRPDTQRAGTEYEYTVFDESNRANLKDPKVIIEDPT